MKAGRMSGGAVCVGGREKCSGRAVIVRSMVVRCILRPRWNATSAVTFVTWCRSAMMICAKYGNDPLCTITHQFTFSSFSFKTGKSCNKFNTKQVTRAPGLTHRKTLFAKLLLWSCCYEAGGSLLVELLFSSWCSFCLGAAALKLLWMYCF